jgi:hypothetical protein
MKWTVVWTKDAENELAKLWVDASDRDTITSAGNAVDAWLSRDPYSNSESRDGSTRVMIPAPLAVAYDVSAEDCMVTVWAVWRI